MNSILDQKFDTNNIYIYQRQLFVSRTSRKNVLGHIFINIPILFDNCVSFSLSRNTNDDDVDLC